MMELSVSMPAGLQNWMESRIADGDYADAADYLRDLVRRDRDTDIAWVRAMIAQGEASGYLDADPKDIIEEVIAELPAADG